MRQADKEKQEAIEKLREWVKPGDTVYTILRHVSRSGMSRDISVVLPSVQCDLTERLEEANGGPKANHRIYFLHPNYSVAKAIGARLKSGNNDAIVMGGCGMDMGFALVYELSHALYGRGYQCLGKGKCPSNYHVNHRDHVSCPEHGPERFDLVHTDGYALRQQWL